MKNVVLATLLVTVGATYAEQAATVQEPAKAKVEGNSHTNWPSLNELWNDTETGQGLQKAITGGTPELEILLGYEYSDLSGNTADPAQALLTRTRLNYQTGRYQGFDAFIQAQYVGPINDHYNYPVGGNPNYDAVADPENFRFQQAYLGYTGYDSQAKIGSQEIILDNARFIGNVGWRLNAQSFNAGSVKNESIDNLKLFYAYADSINDIFGNINHMRQYHLFNAEYKVNDQTKASAFAYLQRNDNSVVNKHVDTYGLRVWGSCSAVNHELIAAAQRDAYYGSAFAEAKIDPVNIGGGVEYISGGETVQERFQTLNGTAHKFNGWADQFLGTGGGLRGGLVDIYGQVSAVPVEKLKLMGVYHYFNTADKTTPNNFSGEYGQEIDLLAKYPVCDNFDVLVKFAHYMKGDNNVDNFTNDEDVFWLRGTLRF